MRTVNFFIIVFGASLTSVYVHSKPTRSHNTFSLTDEIIRVKRLNVDSSAGYLEQCGIVTFPKAQKGVVNVLAFLDSSWPYSHRQAIMLKMLNERLQRSGLPDTLFYAVNVDPAAARTTDNAEDDIEREAWLGVSPDEIQTFAHMVTTTDSLVTSITPDIQLIQDNEDLGIWKELKGSRDQVLIIDRCGKLTYQVIVPWSILHFPYVKAAILSTYKDEPCGPCNVHENPTEDGLQLEDQVTLETVTFGSVPTTEDYLQIEKETVLQSSTPDASQTQSTWNYLTSEAVGIGTEAATMLNLDGLENYTMGINEESKEEMTTSASTASISTAAFTTMEVDSTDSTVTPRPLIDYKITIPTVEDISYSETTPAFELNEESTVTEETIVTNSEKNSVTDSTISEEIIVTNSEKNLVTDSTIFEETIVTNSEKNLVTDSTIFEETIVTNSEKNLVTDSTISEEIIVTNSEEILVTDSTIFEETIVTNSKKNLVTDSTIFEETIVTNSEKNLVTDSTDISYSDATDSSYYDTTSGSYTRNSDGDTEANLEHTTQLFRIDEKSTALSNEKMSESSVENDTTIDSLNLDSLGTVNREEDSATDENVEANTEETLNYTENVFHVEEELEDSEDRVEYSDPNSLLLNFPLRIIMHAPHFHVDGDSTRMHEYLILTYGNSDHHRHLGSYDATRLYRGPQDFHEAPEYLRIQEIEQKKWPMNNVIYNKDESPGLFGEVADYWKNSGGQDSYDYPEENIEEPTVDDILMKMGTFPLNNDENLEKSDEMASGRKPTPFDENLDRTTELTDRFQADFADESVTEIQPTNIEMLYDEEEETRSKLIAHYSKLLPWIYYVLDK